MGTILCDFAYALTILLHLMALLIGFEWVGHQIPGAGLNPARKFLFKTTYPFLKLGALLGLRRTAFDWTPGVMIVLLLLVSRLGLPWVVWFGFSLRG